MSSASLQQRIFLFCPLLSVHSRIALSNGAFLTFCHHCRSRLVLELSLCECLVSVGAPCHGQSNDLYPVVQNFDWNV